ncbi:gtf2h1, partial [Acrasis kona]
TADDFWATHSHQLKTNKISVAQEPGLKNSIFNIAELEQINNQQTLRFTPLVIRQIFSEFPAVKVSYNNNVPHKLSESEFWNRFARSHYFNRRRTQETRAQQDDIFRPYEERLEGKEAKADVGKFVDLTTDDKRECYGVRSDELTAPSRTGASLPILKEFNTRSSRIMQSHIASTDPKEIEADENEDRIHTLMEEQLSSTNHLYIPLNIHDKSRYFEGLQTSTSSQSNHASQPSIMISSSRSELVSDYSASTLMSTFVQEIHELSIDGNLDLQKALVSSSFAEKISVELTNLATETTFTNSQSARIDEDFREQLSSEFHVVVELLRHLWSLLAIPKTKWNPVTTAKAEKLIKTLKDKKESIETLEKEQLHQTTAATAMHNQVNQTKQLTKPLLDTLENAIEAYLSKSAPPKKIANPVPNPVATTVTPNKTNGSSVVSQTPASAPISFGGMTIGKVNSSSPQNAAQPGAPKISFSLGGAAKKPATSTPPPTQGFVMNIPSKPGVRNSNGDPELEPPNKKQKM